MSNNRGYLFKILEAIVPILLEWIGSLLTNPGGGEQDAEEQSEKSPTGLVGT